MTREGCGLEANHSREVGQGASPPGAGTQEHYLRSGRDRKLQVTLEEINHNQADPRGRRTSTPLPAPGWRGEGLCGSRVSKDITLAAPGVLNS